MAINSLQGSKWKLYYKKLFSIAKQNKGGTYSFIDAMEEIMNCKFTIEMLKLVDTKDYADLAPLKREVL
jgi:hypothetical protein